MSTCFDRVTDGISSEGDDEANLDDMREKPYHNQRGGNRSQCPDLAASLECPTMPPDLSGSAPLPGVALDGSRAVWFDSKGVNDIWPSTPRDSGQGQSTDAAKAKQTQCLPSGPSFVTLR